LQDVTHISPCFAYRGKQPGETDADYGARVSTELETAIYANPDSVAAFIAEPVVGATLGAVPAVPGYFQRIREICDKHDVLLILDEVMCGMGRTGTLHACEQEGVSPDLLILAKGLGAGYQPIGAMLVGEKIYQAIAEGSGFFNHGHTYMGHAVGCAAALAVQRVIRDEGLLENVRRQGSILKEMLMRSFGEHPHVGDIRGRGLFCAIEIVKDRASKQPFDARFNLHAAIKRHAMAIGLICYPGGGTADGKAGDHVLIAPPFNVTTSNLEQIVSLLLRATQNALDGIEH
jgi:adenosylmethionine-8-amino-7-oxononanoate aminotransferase